ncbi:transporter [Pseudomonas sp. S1(2024)]|uniref:SphA family protein n=1 Tax=Pseudomonas sp. S1(2024) TaxID=3390191 RepID=UPI00397A6BF9
MLRAPALLIGNRFPVFCAAATLLLNTFAQATEYNGTAYPLGLDTVLAGRMPPPGLTTFLYSSAYKATELKDANGHEQSGVEDFSISYEALAVCLDYVYSDYTLFGATLASRAAQPYISGQVSWYTNTPQGRVRYSGKSAGLANLAFTPLFMGWSSPRVHQMLGVDVYAPTGSYDKDRLFNPGTNVWSYSPWYSITANPIDELEISAKMLYMINENNRETDYRSGKEVNIDYHLGYSVNEHWQVGLSGYLYKQVSDDEQHGESVGENGNRGQVAAFGPVVKYQTAEFGVVLKWQHEALVENRAQGERIWLQAVLLF